MAERGVWHAIDFGTSNSAVVVGRADGTLQRIADPASPADSYSIPTSVCVLRDGQIAVGRAAENAKKLRPGAYRGEFKRDFGDRTPTMLTGKPMTSDDLTAEVLRFLREQAQLVVPEDPELVVIAVPAAWERGNRELMLAAARLAGYGTTPVRLVDEPVAALTHAFSQYHDAQPITVFVYDLGGGTFDCAVARGARGRYEVLGSPGGLGDVGGVAFDRLMLSLVRERFGQAAAAILDGPARDTQTLRRRLNLRDSCENFKCQLSATGYHEDLLTELTPPGLFGLDRPEFEAMVRPLLARTIAECDRLLDELGLTWPEVDRIVPVGGSSRIPLVGQLLDQHTGRTVLHIDRPDLAVAYGAALIGRKERNQMTEKTAPEAVGHQGREQPIGVLKWLFSDQPNLLDVVTLGDLESGHLLEEVRRRTGLFADPVKMVVVGRTGAGKTSLGNSLFGKKAMKTTGRMDCTKSLGVFHMKSNLWYIDTPGAGSNEEYENVTRLGLGLEQANGPRANAVPVHDYTHARVDASGETTGVEENVYTEKQWSEKLADEFAPDVIAFVLAPHMQVLRDDRSYLGDVLGRYGHKVLIALNLWRAGGGTFTTPEHLLDAREKIGEVYRDVFPDGSAEPRFVEFNALTGSGVDELTRELCQKIPADKLGGIQAVLASELKVHAQRERSRQYRRTVNRIAARLALHTVDQQAGGQDLISVAASAVSQYGVLTFEATDLAAQISDEMSAHVDSEVQAVKEKRSEQIIQKDVKTKQKDIIAKDPKFQDEKVETKEKRTRTRVVEETSGKGMREATKAYGKAGVDHLKISFGSGGGETHQERNRRLREELVNRTRQTITEEYEVPVVHIQKKVIGYTTRVIDSVTEVVGIEEQIVGTKALTGGLPVIELLVAVGLGVEKYCTSGGGAGGAEKFVKREQEKARLTLDRARPQLEPLLAQGGPAEDEIVRLLDQEFAG